MRRYDKSDATCARLLQAMANNFLFASAGHHWRTQILQFMFR
jgi:hypothetical protein